MGIFNLKKENKHIPNDVNKSSLKGSQGNTLNKYANKKNSKLDRLKEKIDMYDMIIANLFAGNAIIEPNEDLDNSQIAIGFSNISSAEQITKYYMINKFPDYIAPRLIDVIRSKCNNTGVKINFYYYAQPHRINWSSPEMKNRMSIWRRYSEEHKGNVSVFSYREQRSESLARERMIMSTKYLNEAELEYKRAFLRVYFIIEVSALRDEKSIINMSDSIVKLKRICKQSDIKLSELRINMIDWVRTISPFSLSRIKEIEGRLARKVMTDDLLANFNSYKQGRVGTHGVSLGIDILNGGPVMRKFKEDPDGADNWLIAAGIGGGKSYWVKTLLTFLLAEGFIASIMDYEGDEYNNLANYIRAGNIDDVKIVSMGKGSAVYFDPCEIPDLTGDPDVDVDLKESAIGFIVAVFRLIISGLDGNLSREEERVLSLAIQRMYDTVGVTEDKNTWHRSKGLRLKDIYNEIKNMVETKELVDNDSDNLKHKAAVGIVDASSIYFEEGESKYGTFKNPMSANELYKAKLIIFSFGMRGASDDSTDPVILALKQLSVAYINIKISNYCKYIRHCFNVKVWEEFQRWGLARGSANTISNVITGGRKRGDVNLIITNDLGSFLDDSNLLALRLRQNIQNYAIGKIPDKSVRENFCKKCDQQDLRQAIDNIAKANNNKAGIKSSGSNSRYKFAFCLAMEDGKKAIVKSILPKALSKSDLFKTGVDIKER